MAREMKDSGIEWIGEMPENWTLHRMKTCITDRTSGAWGNEISDSGGNITCLRIADFDYARFRFKNTPVDQLTTRSYDSTNIENLMLHKGDILIEKSGGGEKTPVGRTVIFDKDYPAVYANFMDRLRCSQLVSPEWMQYVFVTFYKNGYSKNYIKQTTGIQNLDLTSMLASEQIPVPSSSEQHRIADFLDAQCSRIDDVIEKTRASIEEYKKLKQAVITEAVTKGIRPNREMKDSGIEWIGEIPAEWNVAKAKYYVVINNGSDPKTEGDIPVYGSGANSFKTCGEFKEGPCVLIGRKGATLHIPHYIDTNYWNVDTAFDVKSKSDFELKYYYYCSICFDYKYYISQTTLPGMTQTNYENMFLPIPSLTEQKEILLYLDGFIFRINNIISRKEISQQVLESYKKSLIYEYVTGKKDVPECPSM